MAEVGEFRAPDNSERFPFEAAIHCCPKVPVPQDLMGLLIEFVEHVVERGGPKSLR
jgi:hypothetical protein